MGVSPSCRSRVTGLTVLLMASFFWACGSTGAGGSGAAERGGSPPAIHTIDFRPLAYFDQHCSRCHGPFGSYYGKDFAGDLSPVALRQKVREMAAGPGGAPVSGDSLAALVAFHQSLSSGQPFIVVTGAGGDSIFGEVSPGVPLRFTCGNRSVTPEIRGYHWALQKPDWLDGCASGDLRLAAGSEPAMTVLNPVESAYSRPPEAPTGR